TGNYNAQVENYRQEVREFDNRISDNELDIKNTTAQLVQTVGVSAREYGILGDNSDETVKIQQLINENDVIVLPIPEEDFYGISEEIVFDIDKTIVFKGSNNVSSTNTNDVLFKWVGGEAPDKAMFRLSTAPIGVEPTDSLHNLKFEG